MQPPCVVNSPVRVCQRCVVVPWVDALTDHVLRKLLVLSLRITLARGAPVEITCQTVQLMEYIKTDQVFGLMVWKWYMFGFIRNPFTFFGIQAEK